MTFYVRGNRRPSYIQHKGNVSKKWTNFTFFAFSMFSLALAVAYQQGEIHSNFSRKSSSFLGTAPVSAAVATTALSSNIPRAGRPTMLSMTAGSSRTLIELTNQENGESGEFQFEVTYLDDDDEQGLFVLRRANVDTTSQENTKSVLASSRAVCKRALRVLKNPIVTLVLAGNIATMVGILPPGIAGFLPAVGIFLSKKTRWAAPVLLRLHSSFRAPGLNAMVSKLKIKLTKAVSNLYKNRSRYSLLSDFLWYVDDGEKKNKNENRNKGASPSTYTGIA